MPWKEYYEHDCPVSGEHHEMSLEKNQGPPECLKCGQEWEVIAD